MLTSVYDFFYHPCDPVDTSELNVKRIQYSRYGGPEELELRNVETPSPGRNQIRVRVLAASANPMDWKSPSPERCWHNAIQSIRRAIR